MAFLTRAALATWVGASKEQEPEQDGFCELRYEEDQWGYCDRYAGYKRSFGQTLVRDSSGLLIWVMNYGGGMSESRFKDNTFVSSTIAFLKLALKQTPVGSDAFFPRGPGFFKEDEWIYEMNSDGRVSSFRGGENIRFKGEIVFSHWFHGGFFVGK